VKKVHSAKYKVQRLYEQGQALVLVLLSLAVVLTLVLFILSRSITDIAVSSKNEQAVRAFSAAEAGIEQALVIGSGVGSTAVGNASFTSSVISYAEGTQDFAYPIEMASGDIATIWFTNHDKTNGNTVCDGTHPCFSGNTLKICWGKTATLSAVPVTPAIEISVFYESIPGNLASIKIARAALDPFVGRSPANGFAPPDDSAGNCAIGGTSYQFSKTIRFSDLGIAASSYNVANGLQFAKVRMLYNTNTSQNMASSVNFAGDSVLPSQGQSIVSTGTAGDSNRKINVFQSWPEAPSVFAGSIYSSAGLVKTVSNSAPLPAPPAVPTASNFSASETGGIITVSYTDISVPTVADWVGIFSPGDSDLNDLGWMYIRNTGTCSKLPGDGLPSGSCQFNVPDTLPVGTYDIRLFTNNSYDKIATNTLVVTSGPPAPTPASLTAVLTGSETGGVITINYSGIASPSTTDWVGIYNPGDTDNLYKDSEYVNSTGLCAKTPGDGKASGSCQFSVPAGITPGDYEIRLFSNNSLTKIGEGTLNIPVPPTPTPEPTPSPTESPSPTP